MRKARRTLVLLAAMLLWLALPAPAASAEEPTTNETNDLYQEQLEASGADELWEQLPQETRAFLKAIGLNGLDTESYTALQPQTLLDALLEQLGQQAGGVATGCGTLLGIVVLGALAGGLRQTVREPGMADTFSVICTAAACGAVLLPVSACVQQVCKAAEGVSVFMLSFVPAYAAVIVAGGQTALAASYSTVLLTGAECTSALTTGVVMPLLTVSLGISAVSSISEKSRVGMLGGLLAKAAGWLLTTVTGVFTALLSLQGPVAASADTLGLRAARMSVSSFVPVVGGALSEAFGTVTGCLRLLKSTLGMFGVLAAAALVVPSLCRCVMWALALSFCRMAAEVLDVQPVTTLLSAAQSVVKTLIGVLAVCALFLIITTTIVTRAGGGV